jgi:hypothetical protein
MELLDNMCKVYSPEPCTPRILLVLVKRNQLLIHLRFLLLSRCRDSSSGIAGWKFGVRFLAGTENFSIFYSVQAGFGAQSSSYPIGTGDSFPWGNVTEALSWPLTSI